MKKTIYENGISKTLVIDDELFESVKTNKADFRVISYAKRREYADEMGVTGGYRCDYTNPAHEVGFKSLAETIEYCKNSGRVCDVRINNQRVTVSALEFIANEV